MTHSWWLITFAVMWPNPNFNFYTLQHVDFKIKILQNVLLKKTINSHFITESILKCPNPGSPDSPSGLSLITQTRSIAGIQINRIFNIDIDIDIAIFQKINIDIDIARAIYCSSNILLCNILLNIDIAQAIYCLKLKY